MTEPSSAEPLGPGAQLLVQVTGEPQPRSFAVPASGSRIGRDATNDIVLDLPWVSRFQCVLRRDDEGWWIEPGPGSTTPVSLRGSKLERPARLDSVDFFRIPGMEPGELITCVLMAEEAPTAPLAGRLEPGADEAITIGADASSTLGAGNELLAEEHARIERAAAGWLITDLSGGYTLVDGTPIDAPTTITAGRISAGGLRLTLTETGIEYRDAASALVPTVRRGRAIPEELLSRSGTGGVTIEARHLGKTVRGGVNLLSDLSLRIRPRELVVIVGLSGAGKSTLLNALSGYRPASEGTVTVGGRDLYANLDEFRTSIGYVPQRDIVHARLTVAEALDYAARLRLPAASGVRRRELVEEVAGDLGLSERLDIPVARLSGGQVKRVSIGVELISHPELLFLDEPTSGLDPVTETGLMQLLRGLADGGRTVVVITHATKNVMLADKVVFMVPGGRVAWYGPPAAALSYFDAHRPEAERLDREMEFDEIYRLLENPDRGSAQEWDERFRSSDEHQRFVAAPLDLDGRGAARGQQPSTPLAGPKGAGFIRQLFTLSARNFKLLSRDRFALILMLAAAPLLASLDFLITERDMFDRVLGNPARIITNTNAIIVNAMLVGALAQMREIIKDRDIYRRERLVNLGIAPYILSKVWVAALLALYQAVWWVGFRYLAVDMPGGTETLAGIYLTMVLVTLAGMMLGLFASAVAPSEDSVTLIVALLIVPQVLFSGAHLPEHQVNHLVQQQMDIMPSRWAFEAFVALGEHGQDVADDACWQLPDEEREALTAEEKAGCECMGESVLDTCQFPGIGSFAIGVEGDAEREQAITLAEGRLAVDHDAYGPIYDVNVASRWLALVVISGALLAIILGIQRIKDRL